MLHNETLHYLDNAATTIVDEAVADAVRKAMVEHWANPSSLYGPGCESRRLLEKARAGVAKTLGASPEEVFFTGCGSESNNIAILGAALARKSWGKRVVVSGYEHPSVAMPMERLRQLGFDVVTIQPDETGHLDLDAFVNAVDKNTILVSCMQVNNEIGTLVDVNRLAKRVKEKNPRTAVHVDGVQAWLRVPVKLEGIDSFTVSGHKIHAPKGVGALYLRRGYNIEPPYLGGGQERGHGGGQEKGVRPGTENLPYAVGMAKAALLGYKSMAERTARMAQLNRRLREGLAAMPGIVFNSPEDAVAEVVNVSTMCIKSETMLHFLETKNVYVSSGSACSKGAASHTLAAMGLEPLRADTALRISLCGNNTEADVDALLAGLAEGMQTLARIR